MIWCMLMKIEGIQSRINQNGRIVIPAVIRKDMGLKLGDIVIMSLEDGVLQIVPQRAGARQNQGKFKKAAKPGTSAFGRREQEEREEPRNQTEEWLG